MRPNQWVRNIGTGNNTGLVWPVESGPPDEFGLYRCLWTVVECVQRGLHVSDPVPGFHPAAWAKEVELLGPEECAALDAEYGLKGTE